ncbi:hypothetical protein ZOSMA_37G00600 [Zostera marina]|uniref:DUF7811 domain-containing protein n=1 Tax=Zostera marina TaxID=29655 RepID=A0A0K9P7P8_ZOSMR|nr:hypothetical protein ZOSMA_37G00600 [Zostera marina]
MADTSALFCLSSFQPLIISSSRFLSQTKLPLSSTTSSSSFSRQKLPRFVRSRVIRDPDDQRNHGEDDPLGFYPWDPRSFSADGGDGIQWLPEDRITLLTSDGLLQIGGSLVPRRISPTDKQRSSQRQERFQESNYMDPEQGLCLGALFNIGATNGLDSGRRLCFFGFCRSIEMLSDVVEDTVLEHGGEVVGAEKASKGLNEKLTMRVAVPLLWGVPPASETLHVAVRSGGGIIDKVYWQWDFL